MKSQSYLVEKAALPDILTYRKFNVFGRSQLLLAMGISTPLCIANRRQETAPTFVYFKSPKA